MNAPVKLPERFERAPEQPAVLEWAMADGIFVKVIELKAGYYFPQHSHAYDHTTFIATGLVRLWEDGHIVGDLVAPITTMILAGVKHTFLALEDARICCLHNLHGDKAVKILEEHELREEV